MRWIWDWDKYHNSHRSKSIRMTKLIFCQNGVLLGRSFWPKDSLVTLILFELWLLWYLAQSQIHRITLYILTKYFTNFYHFAHHFSKISTYLSERKFWLHQIIPFFLALKSIFGQKIMSHIIKVKELNHQKNFKGEQTYPIFVWVLYKAKFQKISMSKNSIIALSAKSLKLAKQTTCSALQTFLC